MEECKYRARWCDIYEDKSRFMRRPWPTFDSMMTRRRGGISSRIKIRAIFSTLSFMVVFVPYVAGNSCTRINRGIDDFLVNVLSLRVLSMNTMATLTTCHPRIQNYGYVG